MSVLRQIRDHPKNKTRLGRNKNVFILHHVLLVQNREVAFLRC